MTKMAKCKHCGRKFSVNDMYQVKSPSSNYFYVCEECKDKEYNYSFENDTFKGKIKKHGITFSCEFETMRRPVHANRLYELKFYPTSDSSVECEWKSPVYNNLSGLHQMFRSIEKLDLVFGNSYGTHTNIGTINSEFPQMHVLRENRYYISLFKPLSDYLYNHTDDCIKIFGRGFVYYAEELTEYSDSLAHRNFINLQHNTHIEYRINKFINANQYFYSVKLCVELTKCVLTNFCDYVDDYYFEPDKLGHRADITANKLVKIFKKYAEKVDSLDTENESDEW